MVCAAGRQSSVRRGRSSSLRSVSCSFAALCHILLPRTRCFDHKRDDTDFNTCCWVYGGLTDHPSVPCDAHHARQEIHARLWQTSTTPRSTTDDGTTHTPTRCLMPQRYLITCVRHGLVCE